MVNLMPVRPPNEWLLASPSRRSQLEQQVSVALGVWKALGFVLVCWVLFAACVVGFTL